MKRLVRVSRTDPGQRQVLATFRLEGEQVVVEEHEPGVIRYLALDQVVPRDAEPPDEDDDESDVTLSPADGQRYYDALDYAFANSSHCFIETVAD